MKRLTILAPSLSYAWRLFGVDLTDLDEDQRASILYVGEGQVNGGWVRELIFHNTENHKEIRFSDSEIEIQTYESLKNYLKVGTIYSIGINYRSDSNKHIFSVEVNEAKIGKSKSKLQTV